MEDLGVPSGRDAPSDEHSTVAAQQVHNVDDRRHAWIGSWEVAPLVYENLTPADIGRTVIYRDYGRAEAGTLSSWRDGRVWARYSRGDTSAAANASDLVFGVLPLDGDLSRAAIAKATREPEPRPKGNPP